MVILSESLKYWPTSSAIKRVFSELIDCFVGLFVPHLVRLLVGADHRLVLPAAALGGGLFLMICDYLASHLLVWETLQTQLPVGVITALLGAPIFVYLLKRQMAD